MGASRQMTGPSSTDLARRESAAAAMRIVPLQRLAMGGRWRTEAMRSYSAPVLLWFTKGQGRITAGGVTRGYGAHNAVYLPPRTMHGFDMLGQVLGMAVFLPRDGDLRFPEDVMHLRLRDARRQIELTTLIDGIERELALAGPVQDRALYHHAGLLSVWLERQLVTEMATRDAPAPKAAHRLAAAYTALVEEDFRTPKGVAAYARELGVTATHLSRACNAACHRSASSILSDRKIYEARRLLKETRIPVKDIATTLGFASAAYFSRAFHSRAGVSPSTFRAKT